MCVCSHMCVAHACVRVPELCFFFLLMWEHDLISADMFFPQRPFISHPAPPLNTSLIVPIDCSVPAMRSHKRPTYGLMFIWVSIWQPILLPCDGLFTVSMSRYRRVSVRLFKMNSCWRYHFACAVTTWNNLSCELASLARTCTWSASETSPSSHITHTDTHTLSSSPFPTSSAGSRGSVCAFAASTSLSPGRWSHSCSSAAGRATPRHGWMGRYRRRRWPVEGWEVNKCGESSRGKQRARRWPHAFGWEPPMANCVQDLQTAVGAAGVRLCSAMTCFKI